MTDTPPTAIDRRGTFAWMLFDWANQPFQTLVVTFIFAPYFAAQVIGDPVAGQAIWGSANAVIGATIALLSPILGAIADRTGARKPWIFWFSVPYLLGCAGLWLAVPGVSPLWPVLVAYGLAFLGSEFTILFTNAMLPDLGPRHEIGRISGSGWALGYVGGLVSLVLVLTLLAPNPGSPHTLIGIAPILGLDPALGEPARATGPLSALWYAIFILPLFLFTRDAPRRAAARGAVRAGLANLWRTLLDLRDQTSLAAFLAGSMIYRDALGALFTFGGIYAAGVLGWGLFQLGLFGISSAAFGALGAWLGGRADRAYGPRPVIMVAIWMLILVCAVILATSRTSVLLLPVAAGSHLPDIVFFIAGGLLGAAAGTLQAASRTLLVHQAEGRVAAAQAFGLYALAGKATAFIGPALVAAVTAATGSQRLGITPIIGLFLIGLLLLGWVKSEAYQSEEPA